MKSTLYQKVKFKELCANITQRIDNPRRAKTDYYVGLEHLDSEEPRILRHGSTRDVNATKLRFKAGDILFGRRNWYLRRVAVVDGRDGICSAHMMVLRPKYQKITKGFLQILMLSDEFYKKGLTISAGSMSPTMRWKELAEVPVFIPSIPEQKKIVDMISRVDDSIAKTQHLLNKLKNYKESKLDILLTRGIGHKKFKKVKWLFGKEIEIPEKWEIKQVKEIFELLKTGTNSRSDLTDDGDVGYIHYGDIHKKWHLILDCNTAEIPLIDSKKVAKVTKLKNGDLIIADASEDHEGSGASILIKNANDKTIVSGLHTIAMRDSNKITHSEFRAYITSSRLVKTQIISYVTGISVYGLSKSNLNTVRIPIPPLPEQIQIASILSGIDVTIKDTRDHLSKLKAMRKSIINEKITPPKMENEIV